MTEQNAHTDDGKGVPESKANATIKGPSREGRQLPGGSMDAAKVAIGINAVDPDQMPSQGRSTGQERYQDTPEEPEPRPAPKP
jgi:hypothetical protein